MNKNRIVAHCQVKNEEVWVWYAIMSVIDYVDEVYVWDTGSIDKTIEIIKTINSSKISFKKAKPTPDEKTLAEVRQEMIEESKEFDWMMILDGDEVWPNRSIQAMTKFINDNGDKYDCIVVPTLNCLGDVFHVSPADAGRYNLLGKVGHFNIRFINLSLPGLHVLSEGGKLLTYLDSDNVEIQNRPWKKIAYIDEAYLHMTHLTRSWDRKNETSVFWRAVKKKYELGLKLPDDFAYPVCFYYPRPKLVTSPFTKRSLGFWLNALWQTPIRRFRRKIKFRI